TGSQSLTVLPGLSLPLATQQFAFADLDPSIPGVDVLYLASQQGSSTLGGLKKFSLVNGTWVANGVVSTGTVSADRYQGLTVKVLGNTVALFWTRRGPNGTAARGGQLVTLTDNSGYNGTLTGTPTVLATVANIDAMAFRGVARVPLGCAAVNGLRAPDVSATQANIFWDNPATGGGNYEYAVTTDVTPPPSGTVTTNTFANVSGLINGTTYYVYVRTQCNALSNSEWSVTSFVTGCKPPAAPPVNIAVSTKGLVDIKWKKVFGADAYEYLISTSAMPPTTGDNSTDTALTVSSLNSVSQYYFHVRSKCGGGAYSEWTTKAFSTDCFMPAISVAVLPGNAGVSWNRINKAVKYEYALTFNPVKPISGSYTSDTVYTTNKVKDGTAYYFHVRSVCINGALSEWSTIPFATQGMQVYPSPVIETLRVKLEGIGNSGDITISDVMGKIVYRKQVNTNSISIPASSWAPGVYLVCYYNGQQRTVVRIIKQ
ncbi:T9SS type A sorting domain-containing protein, partial [Niastella yeongjuensis]|uniref:T9SS type A sorting domain-containing protein n=1 Tax=Niastella yeongjuensis TaxID=354355 RepID=UPI0008CE6273